MTKRKRISILSGIVIVLLALTAYLVLDVWGIQKVRMVGGGDPIYCSYEEMIEKSCLIVRGVVKKQNNSIRIRPAGAQGSTSDVLVTDNYLEITDVLRGEAEIGQRITVRVTGGEDFWMVDESTAEPHIRRGDEVVAFLYPNTFGARYFTQEEFYHIISTHQGWYTRVEGMEEELYRNEAYHPETLSWETIKTEIPALSAKYPINPNWRREELMARYKKGYESGEFSEEEYKEAIAELDIYGTVVHR